MMLMMMMMMMTLCSISVFREMPALTTAVKRVRRVRGHLHKGRRSGPKLNAHCHSDFARSMPSHACHIKQCDISCAFRDALS